MEPSRITAKAAKYKIDHGGGVFFLDIRNDKAWAAADRKLPEAMRLGADEVELWSHKLPRDQLIVT
jgi:hypothetical protein